MVRPALALALPAAMAVELVHNASLLHDDLIGGDRLRRGRPALWSRRGCRPRFWPGTLYSSWRSRPSTPLRHRWAVQRSDPVDGRRAGPVCHPRVATCRGRRSPAGARG
ncbi:polyprenyl synthetase family protein [Streptomyces sp. CA-181903]|uniref:polyprenyl synthetase family protein n=1 Tax=Streptomyces sp. CA-181903 TaxID=3240055 RepID=UPI003D8F37C3